MSETGLILRDAENVLTQPVISHSVAIARADEYAHLWWLVRETSDEADTVKQAMVYYLADTILETGERLWQVVKLNPDEELSTDWADFCRRHLGIADSTASNYKRVWETFGVKLGWTMSELVRIGQSKLQAACSLIKQTYPDVDDRILRALRGAPNLCAVCREYVLEPHPEKCPGCEMPFEGILPLTLAQTELVVSQIKQERRGEDESEETTEFQPYALLADLEVAEGESLRVVPWMEVGDRRYDLPVWEIPLLAEDEVGEGVSMEYLPQLTTLLGKAFS